MRRGKLSPGLPKGEECPQGCFCSCLSAWQRECHRISWPEERTLFALWWLALAGDMALGAEYANPLAPARRSRGGQSPPMLQRARQEGRGAGNGVQGMTGVTNRGICLWACFVRQENIEISALNQTYDKSTGDVRGAGGLLHQPPMPGLPSC